MGKRKSVGHNGQHVFFFLALYFRYQPPPKNPGVVAFELELVTKADGFGGVYQSCFFFGGGMRLRGILAHYETPY